VIMTEPNTAALQPLTISPDPPSPAVSRFSEADNGVPETTALPSKMMQEKPATSERDKPE